MTTMLIDYKASAEKAYQNYEIDREIYPTVDDLKELTYECINSTVYLIRVYENGAELFTVRNSQ